MPKLWSGIKMAKFIKLTSAYNSDDRVFYVNVDRITVIRASKMNHPSYSNLNASIELVGDNGDGVQTYYVQEIPAEILSRIDGDYNGY